jgi:signal transduction histidine kinase
MRDRLGAGALLLLVTLGLLGALQYRWLREVAEAQRARMRSDAAARAAAIAQDFDREITHAFLSLPLDAATADSRDATAYAARYEEFERASRQRGLVKDVYLVEPKKQAADEWELLRFSRDERRLVPAEWPSALGSLRQRLESGPGPTVLADAPALIVPVAPPARAVAGPPVEVALHQLLIRHGPLQPPGRCTVMLLDRDVLAGKLLPEIVAARLAAGGDEYDASVVDTKTGAALYGSAAPGEGDAHADLLRLRLEQLDSAILRSFVPDVLRKNIGERVSVRVVENLGASGTAGSGRWRLLLRHKQGSVEQAVQRTLLRNLAVGFGVLLLLGGSVVLTSASARKERQLAARQLEFVASVSHELRTPLAVIRSAGENLADGVVNEPPQVRRYGALVRDEGLRLTEMVEQVLSFAGAQAQAGERKPLDLAAVVEKAIAAEARAGVVFERAIAPDLPPVLGDASALERAIANLLSNARKYGGPERRIQVRVRRIADGGAVAVTVQDDGPGIEADERERLFQPFFRGRRAREAQAPGSGLGLAIVRRIAEAHAGRVAVESMPGKGAAFTLELPAAPAASSAAASDVQAHPAG